MLVCYLFGGIGNQLFQFLSGLNTSKRENIPAIFDESLIFAFKNYHNTRIYDVFDLKKSINFKKKEVRFLIFLKIKKFILDIFRFFNLSSCVISEKNYHNKITTRCDHHQYGYFQDPIFIKNNLLNIKKILFFKKSFFKIKNFKEISKAKNSVSLHIRRGDYVSQSGKKKYVILDKNYYKNAISLMKKKLQNPIFFVFTDDHKYSSFFLKKIFNKERYKLIYNTTGNQDFFLMSQCKNFIISNSTFSWWGPHFSVSSNKVVICPKRWFVKDSDNVSNNLILNTWFQL